MEKNNKSPFSDLEDEDWPFKDEYLQPTAAINRLYNEFKTHGSLAIAYDFDATVHDFHGTGGTYLEVIQLLQDLREIGCKCYCWTANPDLMFVVKPYLDKHNIPCDGINCDSYIPLPWTSRKPFYSALLDDRAGLAQVFMELTALVEQIKKEKEENESGNTTGSDN